jgi:hypothetical protein
MPLGVRTPADPPEMARHSLTLKIPGGLRLFLGPERNAHLQEPRIVLWVNRPNTAPILPSAQRMPSAGGRSRLVDLLVAKD